MTVHDELKAALERAIIAEGRYIHIDARAFAVELRKWWSFDDRQVHSHSWHDRENFIETKLPELLTTVTSTDCAPLPGQIEHTDGSGAVLIQPAAKDIYACVYLTLIGFRDELTEPQISFICDQIARKVTWKDDGLNEDGSTVTSTDRCEGK